MLSRRHLAPGVLLAWCSVAGCDDSSADGARLLEQLAAEFDELEAERASCLRARGVDYSAMTVTLGYGDAAPGLLSWEQERRLRGYGISHLLDHNVEIELRGGMVPADQFDELAGLDLRGDCGSSLPVEHLHQRLGEEQLRLGGLAAAAPSSDREAARWAACMQERGHRADDPEQLFDALDEQYRSLLSSTEPEDLPKAVQVWATKEIAIANDDLDCLIDGN